MILGTKTLLKITAVLILLESTYAIWALKVFHPLEIAGAIASLFGVNSAHEHVQTYFSQRMDMTANKGISDQ
jgi:hypothetical protein